MLLFRQGSGKRASRRNTFPPRLMSRSTRCYDFKGPYNGYHTRYSPARTRSRREIRSSIRCRSHPTSMRQGLTSSYHIMSTHGNDKRGSRERSHQRSTRVDRNNIHSVLFRLRSIRSKTNRGGRRTSPTSKSRRNGHGIIQNGTTYILFTTYASKLTCTSFNTRFVRRNSKTKRPHRCTCHACYDRKLATRAPCPYRIHRTMNRLSRQNNRSKRYRHRGLTISKTLYRVLYSLRISKFLNGRYITRPLFHFLQEQ